MFRQTTQLMDEDLTIRRLGAEDAAALARLAERDSADPPRGTVYAAATADGSLLAAISLESRVLVADPFVHTAHAATLLRTWARELLGEPSRARVGGLGVAPARAAATPTAARC